MRLHSIPRAIAILVTLAGLLVAIGWVFDIQILQSPSPQWPTTKFISAVCFVMAGAIIFVVHDIIHDKPEVGPIVSSFATLTIIILMASLLSAKFFGIDCGIENLFVKEKLCPPATTMPGQPSIVTMLNFLLIAALDILVKLSVNYWRFAFVALGFFICVTGLTAILGYIIGNNTLSYYVPGFSSAMSFFSALLFSLIGSAFILLGVKHKNLPS